jgi:hypothetical protein
MLGCAVALYLKSVIVTGSGKCQRIRLCVASGLQPLCLQLQTQMRMRKG